MALKESMSLKVLTGIFIFHLFSYKWCNSFHGSSSAYLSFPPSTMKAPTLGRDMANVLENSILRSLGLEYGSYYTSYQGRNKKEKEERGKGEWKRKEWVREEKNVKISV